MKKKILTVGLIITGMIIGCKKEEITIKKCNCDRVIMVYSWQINGKNSGKYITKNDCSKVEKEVTWENEAPKIGECKN